VTVELPDNDLRDLKITPDRLQLEAGLAFTPAAK
jgi:hypothetical protein